MPELAPAPEESAEVPVLQLRMQRISFCILQTGEGLSKADIRRYRMSEQCDLPGLPELLKPSERLERQVAHSVPPFPPELPVFPVVPAAEPVSAAVSEVEPVSEAVISIPAVEPVLVLQAASPVVPAAAVPVAEPAFVVPESELAAAAVQVSAADRMFELPAAGQLPDPVVYCERRMEPRDFPQRFPVFWKDQIADIELFVVLFPADRSSG